MKSEKDKVKIEYGGLFFQVEEKRGLPVLTAFGLKEKPYLGGEGSLLHQVHVAGQNRYFSRGGKAYGGSESEEGKWADVSRSENQEGAEYVFTTRTERTEIKTHFLFFAGIKAVRVYNEVTNISKEEILLEEVSSLFLYPLAESNDGIYENVYFHLPRNSWHAEAQWERRSLAEWGLYNGNGNESFKRIDVQNTGSWSTKKYLPMGALEDANGVMLWEIEHNGSWHYELGEYLNRVYLNVGGPDDAHNRWSKVLAPNETFEGVKAAVVFEEDLEKAFGEMTKYRRKIRRPNNDNINLPVIYNSYMHCLWDYPTPDALRPLIESAARVGAEYFCIDAGWHDEGHWWDTIGRWENSKTRFPNGLRETVDLIHSKGMKAGVWLEPECVGVHCPPIEGLDDKCYFCRSGKRILVHNRYFLDYSDERVQKRMDGVVDRLVREGFEYIKIDYNADVGVGTERGGSLGDGLLEHNRSFLRWLSGIYQRYPDLVIENCASGGCRMDYAMLSLNSVQSTSDQTNYLKYPYISANALTAVTPEQAAMWNYPLRGELTPEEYSEYVESGRELPEFDADKVDKSDIVINMVNCMLGRIHLASHIELLKDWQLALVQEGIDYYRSMTPDKIKSVPYYPIGLAKWGDKFVSAGLQTDKKVYLAIWLLGGEKERKIRLGFAPKSINIGYPNSSDVQIKLDGKQIELRFLRDRDALVLELTK